MAKPHKTLSKTESAIQLGNILKGGAGGGTKKGLIAKAKKLLKIGEKATKSSEPIKEVKKAKKSLKSQNPKLASKVRGKKSTYHLKRAGWKGGKPKPGLTPRHQQLDSNIAAKRMKQRGESASPLFTSSSGKRLDSSEASARFAGRRRLKSDVNPSPKMLGDKIYKKK